MIIFNHIAGEEAHLASHTAGGWQDLHRGSQHTTLFTLFQNNEIRIMKVFLDTDLKKAILIWFPTSILKSQDHF